MLRVLRYILLAILALALLTVASANRASVTLHLLPPEIDAYLQLGLSYQVPLFLVIFAGILAGVLVGFVWEWMRESRIRSEASRNRRRVGHLEREVSTLRGKSPTPEDDVLALLEGKGPGA